MPIWSRMRSPTPCSARPAVRTSATCSRPTNPALEGASSVDLLARVWGELAADGWAIVNVDAIVIMQEPRIAPYRSAMREALSAALATEVERVTVRASTTDRLGFAGRGEGAACQAVALLRRQ